uniref:F-box domain-containing protein n=1 Tax=Aplanochytrium stocchinoi TaxID=215587 RepID=A0A7S3PLE9_9STRA
MDLAIIEQGVIPFFLSLRDLMSLRLVSRGFCSSLTDKLVRLNICLDVFDVTSESPSILPANVGRVFPWIQHLHFYHMHDMRIKLVFPEIINELRNVKELHVHGFVFDEYTLHSISDSLYSGLKKIALDSTTRKFQGSIIEQDGDSTMDEIESSSASLTNMIYKLSPFKLVSLNLQGCLLDDNLVHSICKYFFVLEDLCLANCMAISTPKFLFSSPVIRTLDLNHCFKLKFIDFGAPQDASQVKFLNLSDCFNLKMFPEIDCGFEEIKLLGCYMLDQFTIDSNRIKCIDLRHCMNLASVKILSTSLENLQLSVCPSLDSVHFQGNSLRFLDLALSKRLTRVLLESSSIEHLSLCGCSSLNSLHLSCPNLKPENLLLYGTSFFSSEIGVTEA